VDFTVPIAGMDCNHNNTMNEHMRKALKAAENPAIVFHLTSYELAKGDSGLQATLTGNLAIGGTEKPVTINATVAADSTGGMRMKGTVPIFALKSLAVQCQGRTDDVPSTHTLLSGCSVSAARMLRVLAQAASSGTMTTAGATWSAVLVRLPIRVRMTPSPLGIRVECRRAD
jgi:hypothetical protein